MECQELDSSGVPEKYLNGQLDSVTQDEFEMHVLECPSCQRTLELLQTVRDDLAAHAPEIRAGSSAPRGYLRLAWIAICGLIVVAGGVGFRQVLVHQEGHSAVVQNTPVVSSPPSQSPGANSGLASRSTADSGVKVAAEDRGGLPARSRHASNETVAGNKSQPSNITGNLPLDARDYVNDSNGSPGLHDSGREIERNSVPAAEATAKAKPEDKTVTPSVPQTASSPVFIGDQVAKLATVRPFPYTFARVASSQPSGAGSTRVQRQPQSALSGNPGSGIQPGASGFNTAGDYFREGMSAYIAHDYEAAANLLTQAVTLEPDFSEANLYLGISELLRGSPSEAASALQNAAKDKKLPLSQAAHFFLAKAYLQLGKPGDAENEFRVAAALPGRLAGESNELIKRLDQIRSESGSK